LYGDRVHPPLPKPTRVDLAAAHDRVLPDVIASDLSVLFCGINPGLYSAATGHHLARPGNRFWPALHRGGFTRDQVGPADQTDLLGYRLGITNVVALRYPVNTQIPHTPLPAPNYRSTI
jgi:TDG/mug DNA glycosylase family protein